MKVSQLVAYPKKAAVLIVDADEEFVATLVESGRSSNVHPIGATSAAAAIRELQYCTMPVVGTFVGSNLPDMKWMAVIQASHRLRAGAPVHVLRSGEMPIYEEELVQLGVHRVLGKPIDLGRMVEIVNPMLLDFDSERAMAETQAAIAASQGEDYGPIRADSFLSGSRGIFDVSIRLASGKYLKILQAGDAFDRDRLEGYLKKGVRHFYIRREAQNTYLKFCEHVAARVLKSPHLPLEFKAVQTLNIGELTATALKTFGVGDDEVMHATRFVGTVRDLLQQLPASPHQPNLMRSIEAELATYDHSVATTMIACLLATPLRVSSDFAVQGLGLAAFLHDVGLLALPAELRNLDELSVPEARRKEYETHTELGSRMLLAIRGLDPAVPHAVAMHHVRRNGSGYPKTGATSLNQTAEIIGISDEFSRLLFKASLDPSIDPRRAMEAEVFPGFSKMLVAAFRTVFMPETK